MSLLCLGSFAKTPLSRRVVDAEMTRCQDGSHLDGMQGKLKWNYTTGLELKAFLDVYLSSPEGNGAILKYVDDWYEQMIDDKGRILQNYKKSGFSTDHICPAKTLFELYDATGKEKYRLAMDTIYNQIKEQPRTSEGGFWHKAVYPHQMWLDGLYMAQPFYAEYASRYLEDKDSAYRDILNNLITVARHTYDEKTGLYRHAFDESASMDWCVDKAGRSAHAWGRALGWYCMAIVDVLEFIPEGTEGRKEVEEIFKGIYKTLPEYADPKTGMWYQVLDQPGREGNYVEATASAMFTYAMLKGVRLGILDPSMGRTARKTYRKMVKEFVKTGADGLVELQRCCEVAGLGGKENRKGDYDYYINEKIRSNDPKGIGPLVWAALEMGK